LPDTAGTVPWDFVKTAVLGEVLLFVTEVPLAEKAGR